MVLQAHMESTTQIARIIEMRRNTVYCSLNYPPPVDLALGTLTSIAELAKVIGGHTNEMVAIARRAGASWSQIGKALGVSKQAAHEHFRRSPAEPPSYEHGPRVMTGYAATFSARSQSSRPCDHETFPAFRSAE